MSNIYDVNSIKQLIDNWLEQEQKGEQFPVDFNIAWKIAGYSSKQKGKNKLKYLQDNIDFLTDWLKTPNGGRPSQSIKLSCDAFKHFCLLAETEEGKNIRQYFIESEKKWRLVEQVNPKIAEEIELLNLKLEIAKQEAIKATAEEKVISLRHYVVTSCPEPVQQKILGYQVVREVEFRDRVLKDDEIIRDGSTLNKTQLCHRYKFLTRTGKPDYQRLNKTLNTLNIPSDAWETKVSLMNNVEFKTEYLDQLDEIMLNSDRQLFIGE